MIKLSGVQKVRIPSVFAKFALEMFVLVSLSWRSKSSKTEYLFGISVMEICDWKRGLLVKTGDWDIVRLWGGSIEYWWCLKLLWNNGGEGWLGKTILDCCNVDSVTKKLGKSKSGSKISFCWRFDDEFCKDFVSASSETSKRFQSNVSVVVKFGWVWYKKHLVKSFSWNCYFS